MKTMNNPIVVYGLTKKQIKSLVIQVGNKVFVDGYENYTEEDEEFYTELIRSAIDLLLKQVQAQEPLACKKCNGTGIVNDGEINAYPDGTPYMNGPVKCVKDCPDCEKSTNSAPVQLVAEKPVAYMHTMHTDCGEQRSKFSEDEENPFGEPGVDYSETYPVTCEPLYISRKAIS